MLFILIVVSNRLYYGKCIRKLTSKTRIYSIVFNISVFLAGTKSCNLHHVTHERTCVLQELLTVLQSSSCTTILATRNCAHFYFKTLFGCHNYLVSPSLGCHHHAPSVDVFRFNNFGDICIKIHLFASANHLT